MAASHLVWLVTVIVVRFSVPSESVVLAKAQLKECANDGTGDEQCTSRGVIVTIAIHNEQNRTERLYATVNAVKDPATGQLLQVAKPFQVILSKSKVLIHYPVFNLRKMVNSKPWEKHIKTGSCDDEWKRSKVTCGYQRLKTGARIMYSQGYCCRCYWKGVFGRTTKRGHYLRNPDVVCDFWTKQKSAFCMRFDQLWYGVYEVLTPSLVFDITVEILKRGRNMWHGKTEHATWNKVSTFQISPSVPALTSPDGKVRAKWIGDLDIPEKLHDLSQKFLLIPSDQTYGEADHTDTINNVTYTSSAHFKAMQDAGSKEWLFIDKSMFDFTGSKCNKIGVSYEAFKFQENRCYDKKGRQDFDD
ncbi:hapless 2-like [Corticium candelabrum]|uniref:hapless 2-like n=1 Tax=Corticium candelabrum TaxID=121492 RepID=UPI002E273552|nr:hapless 2-like [Corticium candelabrum]